MSLAKCRMMVESVLTEGKYAVCLSVDEMRSVDDMKILWGRENSSLRVYQVNVRPSLPHQMFEWVVAYGELYPCAESCLVALTRYFRTESVQASLQAAANNPEGQEMFNYIYNRVHAVRCVLSA